MLKNAKYAVEAFSIFFSISMSKIFIPFSDSMTAQEDLLETVVLEKRS